MVQARIQGTLSRSCAAPGKDRADDMQQQCHSHPKVKDGPKRRREAANARGGAAKVKQRSETPEMGSMSVPGLTPVLDAPRSVPMPPMNHPQLRNLNQVAQIYATQPLRTSGSRPPPPSLVAAAGSLENIA